MVRREWFWPAVIAGVAAIAVLSMLDPTGDHPGGWGGPGLTVDESFNVIQGVRLVDHLLAGDLTGFRDVDASLPDHPPLGRLWIGVCHELAYVLSPPQTDVPYSFTCARTAPALAFAATVFLVGWTANRWFGGCAGAMAAASVALMPRTFGHAHLAALESCINLAYCGVVLYLADVWGVVHPGIEADSETASGTLKPELQPKLRTAAVGGLFFGLALLTKIQAILLPIPILIWALTVHGKRALKLIPVWGLVGGLVLFVGWPYLWESPITHGLKYLGRTTDRVPIYTWYQGQPVMDREVPWHYPWVIWGTTIPAGLLLLGACGLWDGLSRTDARRRAALVLSCLAFPLLVFSIPGVAVYDGERLFSVSFPLWGVFCGAGGEFLRRRVALWMSSRLAFGIVALIVAAQCDGVVLMSPCWLSYYNLLTGGLRGAERSGMPVTYWGDGVTRELLQTAAREIPATATPSEKTIAVAPVLHPAQWDEILKQSPELLARDVQFVPYGSPEAAKSRLVLMFPRQEYLPDQLRGALDPDRIVAAVRRDGVLLAALYRLR